ncbi:hypothetical protein BDN71DRAFT_1447204 [Pleurotus eryngii]|uniref:Uncharacterized protein n=1 Tax=Pleurotus eryngii TaxID=5323 RepID=A0A9P5ZYD6_PLEER|nr:hypothetical protein BDN71DRAFT_1447204 [Pleurotus eryngii]
MVGQVVLDIEAHQREFKVTPGLRRGYTHFKLLYQGGTDTGKFLVLPGLRGRELHLSSLKKEHPLAGDRAAFPRRRSARVDFKTCA